MSAETLKMRIHGDPGAPVIVYLPGVHGDWTLVASLRARLCLHTRFIEFTYPRSLEWSLHDYAAAVAQALLAAGIQSGTLLAESFGSQVAWEMLRQNKFTAQRLILGAGFVRHPAMWAMPGAQRFVAGTPDCLRRFVLKVYFGYAWLRFRQSPETMAQVAEFVARRTPLDLQAIAHRIGLINRNDPRSIASGTRIPVYYLSGVLDPIVPWPWVRHWLRHNCPGYRGRRLFLFCDHTVLAIKPKQAAEQILAWMKEQSP